MSISGDKKHCSSYVFIYIFFSTLINFFKNWSEVFYILSITCPEIVQNILSTFLEIGLKFESCEDATRMNMFKFQ